MADFLINSHVRLAEGASLRDLQDLVKQVGELLGKACGDALARGLITAANPLTVALLTSAQHCEQAFAVIHQQINQSSNIVTPEFGGPARGRLH